MKNTELGAESKIYPDNPSNSSNMERDQNDKSRKLFMFSKFKMSPLISFQYFHNRKSEVRSLFKSYLA